MKQLETKLLTTLEYPYLTITWYMDTIIGERSFFKFYVAMFLFALFWGVMSLVVGIIHNQATTVTGNVILVVTSVFLMFMVFYTLFRFYQNVPRIVVDKNSINFNSKAYYWRDLEAIELTGKRPFRFMWEEKEGMLLKFAGERARYIFDDMYENSPEIKSFIEAVINGKPVSANTDIDNETVVTASPLVINANEKRALLQPQAITNEAVVSSELEVSADIKWFKGFPLYSFQGIMLWGMIAFFVGMSIFDFTRHHHESTIIMMVILSVFFFILLCKRFYYFGISKDTLFVKNYNFFWIRNEYSLEGIKEIVFEQRHRMPVTLRIINRDFTSTTYPAATLWSKTWLQLKAELEGKGIKVRNECVSYEPFEFKLFND